MARVTRVTPSCEAPGCDVDVYAKGRCKWHYGRALIGDWDALNGPRPIAHCGQCGVQLRRRDMRLCASCCPTRVRREPVLYPRVCRCPLPDARLDRDFGMCHRCYLKPLALMAPRLREVAA